MSNPKRGRKREAVSYLRQFDIFNPAEFSKPVTIVGCGGIGSSLATTLAKMGIQDLTLIDYDRVAPHNIPNQAYEISDVGKYKVDALASHVKKLGANPKTIKGPLEENRKYIRGIICAGLDSMPPRYNLWEILKNRKTGTYFDGRLGGQKIIVYGVDLTENSHKEAYEYTLHSQAESEQLSCTARSIIDVAYVVSAVMARAVRKQLKEKEMEFVQLIDWEDFSINRITSATDFIESMKEEKEIK